MKPNVINFHFIDHCNYKCKYCFVKKENKMLSLDECKQVVDNIQSYFKKESISGGRINLVGGEIFLAPYLQQLIDYIVLNGIKVSIVTNGALLTEEFIDKNKGKIETIGISVDSLNCFTNIRIGRCCTSKTLTKKRLLEVCLWIKNAGIKLKINHCISKYNVNEDISNFIKEINPNRFKVFQMTIIDGINEKLKDMQVNEDAFLEAASKYIGIGGIIETEETMKDSYLMVDSKGEFYVDKENKPIGNLLKARFSDLIPMSNLNSNHFALRY